MTDEDADATLHDMMTILGSLNIQLIVAEERACLISPSVAIASAEDGQPSSIKRQTSSAIPVDQDTLGRMEEQVRAKIPKHLRRTPTVSFPTTDDDNSDLEDGPRHRSEENQKGSVVDCTWQTLLWCGKRPGHTRSLTHPRASKPSTVMAREKEKIKARMLSHLQEFMEDGHHYG